MAEIHEFNLIYAEITLISHITQLLAKYNRIACLDSTHNSCYSASGRAEKAFLYTVMLKNQETGKGAPAAFMITPSESQYVHRTTNRSPP